MTPGAGFRIRLEIERPPLQLVEYVPRFRDAGHFRHPQPHVHDGVRPHAISSTSEPLVGPAVTVKVFPGDNLMVHKALDVAKPGDVVVVDTGGSPLNAVLGDLVANKAKHRGIAGFIVDGLVRDLPGLIEAGLPIYARGVTPFGPLHRGPGELNYAVSCGGIVVNPGDIIVGDRSGIAVVRREVASDTVMRLRAHRARMQQYVADVKAGNFSNEWVDRQLNADQCQVE